MSGPAGPRSASVGISDAGRYADGSNFKARFLFSDASITHTTRPEARWRRTAESAPRLRGQVHTGLVRRGEGRGGDGLGGQGLASNSLSNHVKERLHPVSSFLVPGRSGSDPLSAS